MEFFMNSIDERMDLYSEYLLVAGKEATAVKLSKSLGTDGYSHDQISKMLGGKLYSSKEMWQAVKPMVQKAGSTCGVLIVDDTIIEKAYSDENALICWHFDHAKGRSVKGINSLNLLFDNGDITLPVAYELARKECHICDANPRSLS
jgi:DDE superfamily endonuclease